MVFNGEIVKKKEMTYISEVKMEDGEGRTPLLQHYLGHNQQNRHPIAITTQLRNSKA